LATRTISHQDLQKIIKEVYLYKRNTDKEIRLLKARIAKLQRAIEKGAIPEDKPDAYEVRAVKDFESKRKRQGERSVPLRSLG